MESLSPESKLLYDILTSETDEIYEAKFASYCARASEAAATATSTPRSTAPLRASSGSAAEASASSATSSASSTPTTAAASSLILSFERDTTDDFTPEARRLCDLLVGGSTSPTPTLASRVCSSAIPTGGILESAATTAVREKDIRAVTPTNCSTICPGGDTSTASTTSSQVASSTFSPSSPTTVSTVLPAPTEIKDVYDATDIRSADLAAWALTGCSAECPDHDASAYATAITPSATTNSSMATCNVVRELTAPEVSEKALEVDVVGDTAPLAAICLPEAPDHNIGREDPVAMLLTPRSVTSSFNQPPGNSPTTASDELMGPAVGVLLESCDHITLAPPAICLILRPSATIDTVVSEVCSISLVLAPGASASPAAFLVDNIDTAKHTENRLQPWPPPRYATSQEENMCKEMPQVLFWLLFVFESTQLMRWAAKNPWPPPFPSICTVFWFASCSILNLHSTLDNLQLSRDCQVMKTITLGYSVLLLVINSVPGVLSLQLQPTLFKGPVSFCYDTHLPIPSTSVESLLDFLFTRRPMCIFWTWCYMDGLHWSPGGTGMAIPDWGMLISSIETWVHVTCDFASVYFQWAITVQQSTSSGAYLVILNERAELQQRYTCARVLLLPLVVCKGWISQLILQGQPHYFELMQWSFSHTQQQSAFCFFTPGHILFPCCAVVQWIIPWIIILVSLRSWFQCYHAQSEFLCSWEHFQWTIAWYLSYHLCVSTPWLFNCLLLVKVVELKPWPSWGLFLCISAVNKNLNSNVCLNLTTGTVVFECSSSSLTAAGMRSVCVQLEQVKMVQCLHYTEPPELNICASATQAMSSTEIKPTRQVWTMLLSYQNGDSVEHSFHQGFELLEISKCGPKMVLHSRHVIQRCPQPTLWEIVWSLHLEYLFVGYQLGQLIWDPGDVLAQHLLSVTRPRAPIPLAWMVGHCSWAGPARELDKRRTGEHIYREDTEVRTRLGTGTDAFQIPVAVLRRRVRQDGHRMVAQALIQWSGMSEEEATWEDNEFLRQQFPSAPAWG